MDPDFKERLKEYDSPGVLWAWVAGAVVLALALVFTFTRGHAEGWNSYRAVTIDGGTVLAQQVQLPTGEFHVLLTDKDRDQSYPWGRKAYDNQFACDQAIRGIQEALDAIADPDPDHQPVVPELADHELVTDVVSVVNAIQLATHKRASLSIRCSKVTAPTRGA